MVKTKKIQINAEYLTNQEGRGKKKKKKKKPQVKNFMTPNKMKQALMERVALHQRAIKDREKSKKEEQEAATNFAGDFKDTLSYLNQVVDKKKTLKHDRKRRRRKKRIAAKNVQTTQKGGSSAPPIVHAKITTKDDPPYGILKGGKKPLYSEYRRTLRNRDRGPSIKFSTPIKDEDAAKVPLVGKRKKKLERLKRKMRTPSLTRKRRLKRYTLGKRKGKVGILIKSRKTRRKIKKEHDNLKKKKLADIKLYLKKHGLLKVGSNAPEKVMREIYETAVLSGDVYNKSGDVLYHNFMNDKKT